MKKKKLKTLRDPETEFVMVDNAPAYALVKPEELRRLKAMEGRVFKARDNLLSLPPDPEMLHKHERFVQLNLLHFILGTGEVGDA